MKISEEYIDYHVKTINIIKADYLGDYSLSLTFDDGKEQVIDFSDFLSKSQHPSIKKYLDRKNFRQFKIIDGNLNWSNYELIFPVWDLYTNSI